MIDVHTPLDSNGKWLSVPDVRDNVNDNPLSPVADFFACNQEPVIIRVPNCGVKSNGAYACTQHFVVSRGKGIIASNVMAGDNMTGWITDPGASNSDLHNLVGTRDRRNRFVGIRALTAARIAGSKKPPHTVARGPHE